MSPVEENRTKEIFFKYIGKIDKNNRRENFHDTLYFRVATLPEAVLNALSLFCLKVKIEEIDFSFNTCNKQTYKMIKRKKFMFLYMQVK